MLKNALFFDKSWKSCHSVGDGVPNPLLPSGGWGLCPQTLKLPLTLNLGVTFDYCSDFLAWLK